MNEIDLYRLKTESIAKTASKIDSLPFQVLYTCSIVSLFLGLCITAASGFDLGAMIAFTPAVFFIPFTVLKSGEYFRKQNENKRISSIQHEILKSELDLKEDEIRMKRNSIHSKEQISLLRDRINMLKMLDSSKISEAEKKELKSTFEIGKRTSSDFIGRDLFEDANTSEAEKNSSSSKSRQNDLN